jgi:hypothetical protein
MPRILALVLALALFSAAAASAAQVPPLPSAPAGVAVVLVADGAALTWDQTSAANFVSVIRDRGGELRQVAGWWGSYAPRHDVYDPDYQPGDRYVIREGLLLATGQGAWSADYGPYQIRLFLPQVTR